LATFKQYLFHNSVHNNNYGYQESITKVYGNNL
jgi:hypothetical protein